MPLPIRFRVAKAVGAGFLEGEDVPVLRRWSIEY